MQLERCWRCQQMRSDVSLAPSDDRQCNACYEDNERQLQEARKKAVDEVPPSGKSRAARVADRNNTYQKIRQQVCDA
jgi:hypothetical protein